MSAPEPSSAPGRGDGDDEAPVATWTVDELADVTGTTVRTIRWYATEGLLPPPRRVGRRAVYDGRHRATLDLIHVLQDHGCTLDEVGERLDRLGPDPDPRALRMEAALVAAWRPPTRDVGDAEELSALAGRHLDAEDIAQLEATGAVVATDDGWTVRPQFSIGVHLLDLDVPLDSLVAADEAIRRHTRLLAEELTSVLHRAVVAPHRAADRSPSETAAMQATIRRLRELTLEAIVAGFRSAADDIVRTSLRDGEVPGRDDDAADREGHAA